MRNEILLMRARRTEARRRLAEVETVCDGLIAEIRMALDPYADSVTELELDRVRTLFEELYEKWTEARALSEKIRRLDRDLGD